MAKGEKAKVKVKLPFCLTKYRAVKTYGRGGHSFTHS